MGSRALARFEAKRQAFFEAFGRYLDAMKEGTELMKPDERRQHNRAFPSCTDWQEAQLPSSLDDVEAKEV